MDECKVIIMGFGSVGQGVANAISMKKDLIKDKKLLLIDDSIVRGTQLRETVEFLYDAGVKEVHVRPACPPILFGFLATGGSIMGAISQLIVFAIACLVYLPFFMAYEKQQNKESAEA